MQELDKLMASLELLDEICVVNWNINFLHKKINNLPHLVEQAVKTRIAKSNILYLPSVIEPIKKDLYKKVHKKLSQKIASLEEDREIIRGEIMFIQGYHLLEN